jgi:hypothetical protein
MVAFTKKISVVGRYSIYKDLQGVAAGVPEHVMIVVLKALKAPLANNFLQSPHQQGTLLLTQFDPTLFVNEVTD